MLSSFVGKLGAAVLIREREKSEFLHPRLKVELGREGMAMQWRRLGLRWMERPAYGAGARRPAWPHQLRA